MKVNLPTFPIAGGCACGAVRYRLTAPPKAIYICHCTDCQTLTTSAFTLSMPVDRESLEITQGQLMSWIRVPPSGNQIPQHVCKVCGVRIYSEPRAGSPVITLRCGSLDDTTWLRPTASIWMKSKQPWVIIPEDVLTYDEAGDFAVVIPEFRKRAGLPPP